MSENHPLRRRANPPFRVHYGSYPASQVQPSQRPPIDLFNDRIRPIVALEGISAQAAGRNRFNFNRLSFLLFLVRVAVHLPRATSRHGGVSSRTRARKIVRLLLLRLLEPPATTASGRCWLVSDQQSCAGCNHARYQCRISSRKCRLARCVPLVRIGSRWALAFLDKIKSKWKPCGGHCRYGP